MVRDAAGLNPVTLLNFTLPNPTNNAACARILSTTAAFNSKTTPVAVPDYTMAAIPASYLAAGSLTFENVAGTSCTGASRGAAPATRARSRSI